MERLTLWHGKRVQELVLDAGQPIEGGVEHDSTFGCERDNVAPPVCMVSASEDEAALLQPVEESHDIAGIQSEYACDVLLRQISALLQECKYQELSVGDVAGLRRRVQRSPACSC